MPQNKLDIQEATQVLHKNMESVNLRRHCYAVSVAMRAIYTYLKEQGISDTSTEHLNEEDWGIVGLLHDADYEMTKTDTTKHTVVLMDWLKVYEVHTHIIEAFQSHNSKITRLRDPQTLLEWSLECCDELTGFIVACALVRPDKKLNSVTLESIVGKWKKKDFAKGVIREQIEQCEDKLGIPLNSFIEIILSAMQKESETLGF